MFSRWNILKEMKEQRDVMFDEEQMRNRAAGGRFYSGQTETGLVSLVMRLGLAKTSRAANQLLIVIAIVAIVLTIAVLYITLSFNAGYDIQDFPAGEVTS
jgi:hypothetical protein